MVGDVGGGAEAAVGLTRRAIRIGKQHTNTHTLSVLLGGEVGLRVGRKVGQWQLEMLRVVVDAA